MDIQKKEKWTYKNKICNQCNLFTLPQLPREPAPTAENIEDCSRARGAAATMHATICLLYASYFQSMGAKPKARYRLKLSARKANPPTEHQQSSLRYQKTHVEPKKVHPFMKADKKSRETAPKPLPMRVRRTRTEGQKTSTPIEPDTMLIRDSITKHVRVAKTKNLNTTNLSLRVLTEPPLLNLCSTSPEAFRGGLSTNRQAIILLVKEKLVKLPHATQ